MLCSDRERERERERERQRERERERERERDVIHVKHAMMSSSKPTRASADWRVSLDKSFFILFFNQFAFVGKFCEFFEGFDLYNNC
jgi:hypothetical protein